MHCGTTFSDDEVTQILIDSGLVPGTEEFHEAKRRQFFPADGMPGQYVDNPSFNPDEAKPA